jgi:glycosyltransferase involved in cell wall biosynthesis
MTELTSIVLPVHNQADHIGGIVDGYVGRLRPMSIPFELVLVPNAVTDRSTEVCNELAERHEEVRALEELARGGWGRAVRAGLREARGDLLGYTNSARTTPEILALMLAYATAYPQVVLKANRRIRESFRRRLGSVLYNLEARSLFNLSVWDINGTPKLFPRSFDRLLALTRDDDLIDLEFVIVCRREDYPLLEVPLIVNERHGGRSTTNYRSAVRMYWGAYQLRRQLADG